MTSPISQPAILPFDPTQASNCRGVFHRTVAGLVDQLDTQTVSVEDYKPEQLHQIRVLLVRLEAIFRFYRPMISKSAYGRLHRRLRRLNRELGLARDADVNFELASRKLKSNAGESLQTLETRARRGHLRAAAAIGSPDFKALVDEGRQFLSDGSRTSEDAVRACLQLSPIHTFALLRLDQWSAKLARKHASLMTTRARHKTRRLARRYRYAAEALKSAGLVLSRHQEKALLVTRSLQQSLGNLNDLTRLTDAVGKQRRLKLRKRTTAIVKDAVDQLADLRR